MSELTFFRDVFIDDQFAVPQIVKNRTEIVRISIDQIGAIVVLCYVTE